MVQFGGSLCPVYVVSLTSRTHQKPNRITGSDARVSHFLPASSPAARPPRYNPGKRSHSGSWPQDAGDAPADRAYAPRGIPGEHRGATRTPQHPHGQKRASLLDFTRLTHPRSSMTIRAQALHGLPPTLPEVSPTAMASFSPVLASPAKTSKIAVATSRPSVSLQRASRTALPQVDHQSTTRPIAREPGDRL